MSIAGYPDHEHQSKHPSIYFVYITIYEGDEDVGAAVIVNTSNATSVADEAYIPMTWSREDLKKAQHDDPDIGPIIPWTIMP